MLEGWYCRSLANEQAGGKSEDCREESSSEEESAGDLGKMNPSIDYKKQYVDLKKRLKFLLYENEFFQESLTTNQRRLMKVTRDRSFLLDKLLAHERIDNSSSGSEETESSEDEKPEYTKRKKLDNSGSGNTNVQKQQNTVKRKKGAPKKTSVPPIPVPVNSSLMSVEGHLTPEEVERHLQIRQTFMDLVPERAPPTVPNEMFSNEQ